MSVNPLDVPDVTEPYQPRSGQRGTGFLAGPSGSGITPARPSAHTWRSG